MEENIDALCAKAGELALLGVPVFVFQEGRNPVAEACVSRDRAHQPRRLVRFDAASAHELAALLRAVAAYAAGAGRPSWRSPRRAAGARLLLQQMGPA